VFCDRDEVRGNRFFSFDSEQVCDEGLNFKQSSLMRPLYRNCLHCLFHGQGLNWRVFEGATSATARIFIAPVYHISNKSFRVIVSLIRAHSSGALWLQNWEETPAKPPFSALVFTDTSRLPPTQQQLKRSF